MQLAVHARWFWTEHIAVEIFGYGAGAPPQTSRENAVLFYLMRFAVTDPVLFAASVVAVPAFFTALRRRGAGATLLACWLVLTLGATLAWQYRNASYLLALVPAVALMATCYGPFAAKRSSRWMLGMICAGIIIKLATPDLPSGLSYRAGTVQPAAPALSAYCESGRGNPLIVVDLADDLYAAALPLARLRYATVGATPPSAGYGMPFDQMGIVVTVPQFTHLPELEGAFRDRLRQWGIDSTDPIGTLIIARSPAELAELVRARHEDDFLVPERYATELMNTGHDFERAARGYIFLLSKEKKAIVRRPPGNCRM